MCAHMFACAHMKIPLIFVLQGSKFVRLTNVFCLYETETNPCFFSPWGFPDKYGPWTQGTWVASHWGQEQPLEVGPGSVAALGPSTAESVLLPSSVPLST